MLFLGGVHEIMWGIAEAFAAAGATLILTYKAGEDAPRIPATLSDATLLPVTLNNPEQLQQTLSAHAFDTAIVSPGWFKHAAFMAGEATDVYQDIDAAFDVNFADSTFAAQAAAKHMAANQQAGSIIFLSSVVGKIPMVKTNLTGASLAAIDVVARMAAVDLAPHGIRVNIVSAGWILGDWAAPVLTDKQTMYTTADIPLSKAGRPADVGHACCFLASPMASYITGSVLTVDGGFSLTKSAAASPYAHG
ncbi:MAG: SDR family oxidoreductase [Bacteroidota bacterium]